MWKILGRVLSGPIIKGLLDGYRVKKEFDNNHENREVQLTERSLELDQQEARLNNDRKGQILGNWYAPENLFAYFIAFPYWFKAVTIDNTIGSFFDFDWTTPPLGGATAEIMMMIMVFWFGKRTINTVATIIASAFGKH